MKKKILIIIYSLGMGGAEKSLISLLNCLPEDIWDIDLIVANPRGEHMKEIPSHIHLIRDLYELENFASPLNQRTKKICNTSDLIHQVQWQLLNKVKKKNTTLSYGEFRWQIWGRKLPILSKNYDLAISYMNGFTNYYVMEKVKSPKKIIWIHNEFEKLGYDYNFERPYYEMADKIVTISQACVNSFVRVWPDLAEKIMVLENISSASMILDKAKKKPQGDLFFSFKGIRILSIGRLSDQKNFSLAIDSAKRLRDYKKDFLWYILGEGELRKILEMQIAKNNLEDYVKLAGIRENPYPYIENCDVFVQSSKYEGKSIVLDEAKILCKPIVVTDYVTVTNSIIPDVNGLVVDMNVKALSDGILSVIEEDDRRNRYIQQLKNEKNGNEKEILKYIRLFKELLGETNDEENFDSD